MKYFCNNKNFKIGRIGKVRIMEGGRREEGRIKGKWYSVGEGV